MAFHITPSLGPTISINNGALPTLGYWDSGRSTPSPQLGSVVKGSDGHDYILAVASGTVASGAAVAVTEPGMTFATGSGWTAPTFTGGFTSGQYAWLKRTAL